MLSFKVFVGLDIFSRLEESLVGDVTLHSNVRVELCIILIDTTRVLITITRIYEPWLGGSGFAWDEWIMNLEHPGTQTACRL